MPGKLGREGYYRGSCVAGWVCALKVVEPSERHIGPVYCRGRRTIRDGKAVPTAEAY